MNRDLSQYIGRFVLIQEPKGLRFNVLVLEASALAIYGLVVDKGVSVNNYSITRVPVNGQAGLFEICSVINNNPLLQQLRNNLHDLLAARYAFGQIDTETIHKASIYELLSDLEKKQQSVSEFDLSSLFSSGPAREQAMGIDEPDNKNIGESEINMEGDYEGMDEGPEKVLCVHIPFVVTREQIEQGINLHLKLNPKEQ